MKISIYSVILAVSIISFSACNERPHSSAGTGDDPQQPMPVDSVLKPLSTAQADIQSFDTISTYIIDSVSGRGGAHQENPSIKAFTVRAVDLYAAMGVDQANIPNTPYDHIRVYLGYNTENNNFKLYIVPVENADIREGIPGTDLTLNENGTPEPGGSFVLDLNAPCPNLCDPNSPLVSQ